MPARLNAFDRTIFNSDTYWKTNSVNELIDRVHTAADGWAIYRLFSHTSSVNHRPVYRHFGIDQAAQEAAEQYGWTNGCYALAEHLGKPKTAAKRWPDDYKSPEAIAADPHWPTIRLRHFEYLVKDGQHITSLIPSILEVVPHEDIKNILHTHRDLPATRVSATQFARAQLGLQFRTNRAPTPILHQ
jgi:hypothetical protein